MLKAEQKKASWSWLGFFLILIGKYATNPESGLQPLALIISILGAIIFVYGTCMLAKAKGYNWKWGFLGLLFLLGLLILICLKDKNKEL